MFFIAGFVVKHKKRPNLMVRLYILHQFALLLTVSQYTVLGQLMLITRKKALTASQYQIAKTDFM